MAGSPSRSPKTLTASRAGAQAYRDDCRADRCVAVHMEKDKIMSETSESSTEATVVTTSPPAPSSRLTQVAAWVGIVAGIVFIVALIFFSGFCAGSYSGGGYWHGGYRHYQPQQGPGCPMGSGGMMGPGMMGPGMMGPGMTEPGQKPMGPASPSSRP